MSSAPGGHGNAYGHPYPAQIREKEVCVPRLPQMGDQDADESYLETLTLTDLQFGGYPASFAAMSMADTQKIDRPSARSLTRPPPTYTPAMTSGPSGGPPDREQVAEAAGLDHWIDYTSEPDPGPKERPGFHPLMIVAAVIAVVIVAAMVALRPSGVARERAERELSVLGVPSIFYGAEVTSVDQYVCDFDPELECITITFVIGQGPDRGETYSQDFFPGGAIPDFAVGQSVVLAYRPATGVIEERTLVPCLFEPADDCVNLLIRMTAGDAAGTVVAWEVSAGLVDYVVGQQVQVSFQGEGEGTVVGSVSPVAIDTQYSFSDFQRRSVLVWVAVAFALAVIALGGWRGVAALAGLGMTVLVLLLYVLPAILDGRSPVVVALVGSAAIAYIALYLAHGINPMTTTALLGTVAALVITALLATLVVSLADFTGLAGEESGLLTLFQGVDLRGLLLAGMVLGAAGALDDVTVTQASAVWELHHADPAMTPQELFVRGSRIGRDHIASTVNTLLLAYAGASLPLMILLVLSQQSLGSIVNSEVIAVEVVRTLVGSIGLVAAVPITTWLATRTVHTAHRRGGFSEG